MEDDVLRLEKWAAQREAELLRGENAQLKEGWENEISQANWYMEQSKRLREALGYYCVELETENKQLREVLGVLLPELPMVLSPEAQLAYVKAQRLLRRGDER